MDILDLELQWNWVWVLYMGSSYTVIVLQREMRTSKFQHWSTTTGRFMAASRIPLQLILVDHIFIYFSPPLMIDPIYIKYPNISLIFFQSPSMLPQKIMLVILVPHLIHQISLLLITLILSIILLNMGLSRLGST